MTTPSKRVSIDQIIENLQEIIDNADNSDVRSRLEQYGEELAEIKEHMTDSKSGKGILTRLALIEKNLQDLDNWKSTQGSTTSIDRTGKWLVYAAIATGVVSGLISLVTHLLHKV